MIGASLDATRSSDTIRRRTAATRRSLNLLLLVGDDEGLLLLPTPPPTPRTTTTALHPSLVLPSRRFKPQSRFLRLTTAARQPSEGPTRVTLRREWNPLPEPPSWKIPNAIAFDLLASTTILALHTLMPRMATALNNHKPHFIIVSRLTSCFPSHYSPPLLQIRSTPPDTTFLDLDFMLSTPSLLCYFMFHLRFPCLDAALPLLPYAFN